MPSIGKTLFHFLLNQMVIFNLTTSPAADIEIGLNLERTVKIHFLISGRIILALPGKEIGKHSE